MKLCVFFIVSLLPWIAQVGDWALRWTEGSEALQIAFVMFIFPLLMNILQYYIIDSFIKDNKREQGYREVNGNEADADVDEERERFVVDDEDGLTDDEDDVRKSREALAEANTTPMPFRNGEGSGKGISRKED